VHHEEQLDEMRSNSEDEDADRFTSNFGTGDKEGSNDQAKYFPEKDLSSESLRRMKERNERILGGLDREYETGEKGGVE
jgi:hypothetical protein